MDKASPAILPLLSSGLDTKPDPEKTWTFPLENPSGWSTAIGRHWRDGWRYDLCRLCPRERCNLEDGFCVQNVNTLVDADDAPTFSLARFLGASAAAPDGAACG